MKYVNTFVFYKTNNKIITDSVRMEDLNQTRTSTFLMQRPKPLGTLPPLCMFAVVLGGLVYSGIASTASPR